jgi:hypothetical protein
MNRSLLPFCIAVFFCIRLNYDKLISRSFRRLVMRVVQTLCKICKDCYIGWGERTKTNLCAQIFIALFHFSYWFEFVIHFKQAEKKTRVSEWEREREGEGEKEEIFLESPTSTDKSMWQRAFCIKLILLFIQSLQLNYVSREFFFWKLFSSLSMHFNPKNTTAFSWQFNRAGEEVIYYRFCKNCTHSRKDHDERVKKKQFIAEAYQKRAVYSSEKSIIH